MARDGMAERRVDFSPSSCDFVIDLLRSLSSDVAGITAQISCKVKDLLGFESLFALTAPPEELFIWGEVRGERLKLLGEAEIKRVPELHRAIGRGETVLIDDGALSEELRSMLKEDRPGLVLIAPMMMDGKAFGAGIYWGKGKLSREEIALLEVVTCIAGSSLSNAVARKLIREIRARYMTVMDKLDAAVVIAQDERIKYANDKALKLTGYSREELYSVPIHRLISPRDRERIINTYRRRMAGERVEEEYGFWVLRKDGREVFVEGIYSVVPFRGRRAVIAILRDATEKRKLEREAERARRLESLRVLTGGLAHNFNNLLCGIMGNASLIKLTVPPDAPSYRRADAIEKLSQKGAELVRQLLIFAQRLEEEHKPADLNAVVEGKLIELEGKLGREDIRFDFRPSPRPLPVKIPLSAFSLALENVLENAVEAMPEGGTVKAELFEREDMAVLTVQDEGKGIKREHIDKVFDPFFSTKDPSEGAGLGLSLIHSVVNECGGRVDISSSENGTTVTIRLPIFRGEAGPEEKSGRYIMIVSGTHRELIRDALQSEGFDKLIAVPSAEVAEELFERLQRDIALAILDLSLPGAKELFGVMRGRSPSLKAILISNDPEDEKLLEIGGVRVLPKPIPIDKLIQLAKRAVEVEGIWI